MVRSPGADMKVVVLREDDKNVELRQKESRRDAKKMAEKKSEEGVL
jgi:hypothetical protein